MRKVPAVEHSGGDGTDVTRVLHMGPMAGPTLSHHSLEPSAGFEMNLYAYSLPNGSPGRPFVRIADGDDTAADYFDTHSVEALRDFQDRLVDSLAGLTGFMRKIQAWDRSASMVERAWDEAARRHRPCQGTAGQGTSCTLCDPAGASPSELMWAELTHSLRSS